MIAVGVVREEGLPVAHSTRDHPAVAGARSFVRDAWCSRPWRPRPPPPRPLAIVTGVARDVENPGPMSSRFSPSGTVKARSGSVGLSPASSRAPGA